MNLADRKHGFLHCSVFAPLVQFYWNHSRQAISPRSYRGCDRRLGGAAAILIKLYRTSSDEFRAIGLRLPTVRMTCWFEPRFGGAFLFSAYGTGQRQWRCSARLPEQPEA